MLRRYTSLTLVLLATLLLLTPAHAQQKRRFDRLGEDILERIQEFYPVRSTEMGIHSYDHRLADYSDGSVDDIIGDLNSFQKKIYRYRNYDLRPYDQLNYYLLKSELDVALLRVKQIQWHRKSPLLYAEEAVNGLYYLMLSPQAELSEKLLPILGRVKEVPELFETAQDNLKSPPAIYIEAALESLESGMQFYREVRAELMKQFPERADEILKHFTAAREAMNAFMNYLAELTPGKEKSFAIGKKNFDYMLAHQHFLDFDSDSLLRLGETLLSEARQEYDSYREVVEDDHQTGREPVFVPKSFNRDDILDYYDWEVQQVKAFLEQNDILTVPENIARVDVVQTPPFLQTMIAGIAYQPAGPFDSVKKALFYVRPVPDSLDERQLEARYRYIMRRGFKGSVVHEAYPGHHLQFQIAGNIPDPIRKWHYNTMFGEGWALYCEEMMHEQGLYDDDEEPAMWLAVLGGIRFRAARIVADVKLHTGQFTYDECVAWMQDVLEANTSSEKEYLAREVRKIAHYPTYRMAYLTGKREMLRLREAAREKWGEDFTLRIFHDNLLRHGAVPPTLLWDVMDLADYRDKVALTN